MFELWIIGGIISLLTAALGTFLALKVQYSFLKRTRIEQEAWQYAQEAHQSIWEIGQEKHVFELEKKLTRQVDEIQAAWEAWEVKDQERIAKINLEHVLARLPRIDEAPIPLDGHGPRPQAPAHWEPPNFYRADLSGRDLSRRYLVDADLREAQLQGTNFYLADLSGACLAGANLEGATLAGANLAGADLRGAILTGANLLVADLRKAVLTGANLLGARNLTTEQVDATIYDHTTRFDSQIDITIPRIPVPPRATLQELPKTPMIRQALDSPLLLPLSAGDSQRDQLAPGSRADRQENRHIEALDTASSRIRQNGIK